MLDASDHPQLWAIKDRSTKQPLLGCGSCLDRDRCGGLHVTNGGATAMDCMSMCRCADPDSCDVVCPSAPARFMRRFDEVHGFDLTVVPVAKPHTIPSLPELVPLLEGNVVGAQPSRALTHAAIPLSMAVTGARLHTKPKGKRELEHSFGVAPRHGWIASGVEKDSRVERMWGLASPQRVYAGMRRAGIVFATTPNFSTFADVPRHDNLHAMMRIAWTWYQMVEAGLPTALHLNGRTDHDFLRWAEFARRQPNLRAVAFEFLTGAEPLEDGQRYVNRLKQFAQHSGRDDLLLAVRGGVQWLPQLRHYFGQILVIDSGPYFKTVKRQRLVVNGEGKVGYQSHGTSTTAETHALLLHNVHAKLSLHARTSQSAPLQPELVFDAVEESAPAQVQTHHETAQPDLFSEHPPACVTGALDFDAGVVTAHTK